MLDFQFFYGGNFNLAVIVKVAQGDYFIKWNQGDHEGMFESEARSLQLLRDTGVVSIPQVINYGRIIDKDYLMIEFLTASFKQPNYWQDFGRNSLIYTSKQTHNMDWISIISLGHCDKATNGWTMA